MAQIVNMPRLSDTMEEGVVAKWLKKVGDKVEEGDILAEIETDKATMEFESFNEGVLLHIGVQEGETAPVDTLLAILGDKGEDISALLSGGAANGKAEAAPAKEAPKQETKEETAPVASSGSSELPEGVKVITMPRLSDTMEEGTVATWLKKVGDKVEEGDILAEIETDKATMEFESFNEGTLLFVGLKEGETAPVDSVLAIIGPAGTDVSGIAANFSKGGHGVSNGKEAEAPKAGAAPVVETTPAKTEEKRSAPVATVSSNGRIFASPLAKKLAEEKGINLAEVQGTGDHGRIIKADIENFTPSSAAPVSSGSASGIGTFVPAGEESFEEVKNSQMRKAIAKSLSASKFTAPEYYLTVELDMTNAMASRKQMNALPDTKISFNDMVVKACAMALRKHPQVNTVWADDATKYAKHISIGVAVAVPDGLVVPVVKFTDHLTLSQIGAQVKDLAGKARDKKLSLEEMQGSTFTVSNLGMFGITEFTSIINQPNSAILSVGTIVQKPVVKDGEIVVGNTMKVTLACDHRTVDGATGAQFLQTLKSYIENPVTMLV
ncbi:pyruvate dehydrogenase complex dihydrolipoamide acetyltransferase [Spongiivirga citrea]|uniref:Acetyltransferase component of pyruvate dehydrogenase complex n=1 Tax=Spongiivirga citrea TaxID=1481457 RepID=A0A6M0CK43_9FLAO|nr:pyruvate dehydrogenase complex dihydrolipoamide acetyltransferase [Spongiivirga citrea]NER18328.1 pyruvate dehydrogenase complex dihydrolipoamide acetyltransferase [Spongiivirga citrea]